MSVKASLPTLRVAKEAFTTFRHHDSRPQGLPPDRHVPNATYETLNVPNEAFETLRVSGDGCLSALVVSGNEG